MKVIPFNRAVLGRSKIQGPVLSNHLQDAFIKWEKIEASQQSYWVPVMGSTPRVGPSVLAKFERIICSEKNHAGT